MSDPNDQVVLTEGLQLLRQFGVSDLLRSCKGVLVNDDLDHVILDAIALTLMTGKPGEAFAAAFDKRQGIMLVLAKNGPVTEEDSHTVRDLIKTITATTTQSVVDVYPFLLSRGRKSIKKQTGEILKAADEFSHDINAIFDSDRYIPKPTVEEEFPDSACYRRHKYPDGVEPSYAQMMRDLLADLKLVAARTDSPTAAMAFSPLVDVVSMLSGCSSLRWACECKYAVKHFQVARNLKRRLLKFCRYIQGINILIKSARRFGSHDIRYCWVDPIAAGTGESTLALSGNHLDAISRAFGHSLSECDQERLAHKFPKMQNEWSNSRNITICLHVEIRLLLHLSGPSIGQDQPMPIGCSKRTCPCCALWIEAYNREFNTNWQTSDSGGKPHAGWALPGPSYAHVNDAVLDQVSQRLIDKLEAILLPTKSAFSFDDRPSSMPDEMEATIYERLEEYFRQQRIGESSTEP
ncbi:hypothetical protein F5I97DRAFT_1420620 [Phlebopus sp. FC_14]|nr:hypothetical protein F5I97DRAFT_1420620 [Phlebopus sp. FC_14]